ncbi:hypothetical protein M885DRAFT_285416 [Pelagophyceae sp. CCMP2097]|nr:hypothetical protein M885DRAFT_285416 [Pelagophyceae sp. CCMP2097]
MPNPSREARQREALVAACTRKRSWAVAKRISVFFQLHLATSRESERTCEKARGLPRRWLSQIPELSYLSHMVFRLWEDKSMDPADPRRHMVELSFSPGTPLEYNTEESPGRADDGGDDSDDEFDVAGPRLLVGKHRSLVGGGPPQGRRLGQLYGFGTRSEAAPPVFFQPHWSAYSNPAVDSCRCPLNRSNALPTHHPLGPRLDAVSDRVVEPLKDNSSITEDAPRSKGGLCAAAARPSPLKEPLGAPARRLRRCCRPRRCWRGFAR